jgi:hypothetical protein
MSGVITSQRRVCLRRVRRGFRTSAKEVVVTTRRKGRLEDVDTVRSIADVYSKGAPLFLSLHHIYSLLPLKKKTASTKVDLA